MKKENQYNKQYYYFDFKNIKKKRKRKKLTHQFIGSSFNIYHKHHFQNFQIHSKSSCSSQLIDWKEKLFRELISYFEIQILLKLLCDINIIKGDIVVKVCGHNLRYLRHLIWEIQIFLISSDFLIWETILFFPQKYLKIYTINPL